jgi:hypothetical protein
MMLIPLRPSSKKADWLKDDQLQSLWDTGASHSFVSRQLAEILRAQGWKTRAVAPLNGRGINSTWRVDQAIALTFKVGLVEQEFFWEFLISDLPKAFSFMIGMDFMAKHNVVIETARHCVHWRSGNKPPFRHNVVLASVPVALAIGKDEEVRRTEIRRQRRTPVIPPFVGISRVDDAEWHFWQESGGGCYFTGVEGNNGEGGGSERERGRSVRYSSHDFTPRPIIATTNTTVTAATATTATTTPIATATAPTTTTAIITTAATTMANNSSAIIAEESGDKVWLLAVVVVVCLSAVFSVLADGKQGGMEVDPVGFSGWEWLLLRVSYLLVMSILAASDAVCLSIPLDAATPDMELTLPDIELSLCAVTDSLAPYVSEAGRVSLGARMATTSLSTNPVRTRGASVSTAITTLGFSWITSLQSCTTWDQGFSWSMELWAYIAAIGRYPFNWILAFLGVSWLSGEYLALSLQLDTRIFMVI